MKSLPDNIIVVGGGGHAKVVIATVRAAGGDVVGVYDDNQARWGQELLGAPIKGPIPEKAIEEGPAIIAIGDNHARRATAERIEAEWVTVCHPDAVVHPTVSLGPGTVVFAGGVIQPDTTIGVHAIINTAASIDHDCVLGDYVHVAPGVSLCGGVTLGNGVLMGVGAKASPLVRIGEGAIVGAGTVCIEDVASGTTVVGAPARVVGRS
jgi:sugar O-acyltransferase (sialic acid O-acetyltransferase NeuD family)